MNLNSFLTNKNSSSILTKYHSIKIRLASPQRIKQWAKRSNKILKESQLINPKTFNYKTLKPEKGGLFCENIFGPITNSQNRRYKLGYIELIAPVTHIWYLKGSISYISILLNMKKKHLESIVYCSEYVSPHVKSFTEPLTIHNISSLIKLNSFQFCFDFKQTIRFHLPLNGNKGKKNDLKFKIYEHKSLKQFSNKVLLKKPITNKSVFDINKSIYINRDVMKKQRQLVETSKVQPFKHVSFLKTNIYWAQLIQTPFVLYPHATSLFLKRWYLFSSMNPRNKRNTTFFIKNKLQLLKQIDFVHFSFMHLFSFSVRNKTNQTQIKKNDSRVFICWNLFYKKFRNPACVWINTNGLFVSKTFLLDTNKPMCHLSKKTYSIFVNSTQTLSSRLKQTCIHQHCAFPTQSSVFHQKQFKEPQMECLLSKLLPKQSFLKDCFFVKNQIVPFCFTIHSSFQGYSKNQLLEGIQHNKYNVVLNEVSFCPFQRTNPFVFKTKPFALFLININNKLSMINKIQKTCLFFSSKQIYIFLNQSQKKRLVFKPKKWVFLDHFLQRQKIDKRTNTIQIKNYLNRFMPIKQTKKGYCRNKMSDIKLFIIQRDFLFFDRVFDFKKMKKDFFIQLHKSISFKDNVPFDNKKKETLLSQKSF